MPVPNSARVTEQRDQAQRSERGGCGIARERAGDAIAGFGSGKRV